MTRSKRKVPSYRHHKPSGRGVVTLNGKDYFLGKHGTDLSREKYSRLIAEWLANGRRMPIEPNADMTVTELCAAYWRHAKDYHRSERQEKIKTALRRLRRLYGSVAISEFGPLSLKTLLLACRATRSDDRLD